MDDATRRAALALNAINEEDHFFQTTLRKETLSSSRRGERVLKVQEHMLEFVQDSCCKVRCCGFLELQKSVEWPRFGGYVPMVKESRMSQPVGSISVSLLEKKITESVKLFESLPIKMRDYYKYYSSGSAIKVADLDSLKATKKCLMVKGGRYAQLAYMLLKRKVIELVDTKTL